MPQHAVKFTCALGIAALWALLLTGVIMLDEWAGFPCSGVLAVSVCMFVFAWKIGDWTD